MTAKNGEHLRLITYLAPNYPLPMYQLFQDYLEKVLERDSYLIVESRWSGPPKSREDPFTTDDVDMGFLTSHSYLKMKARGNSYMQLLDVAPVFNHPLAEGRAVYFSEVVVRKENVEKYKKFEDLKGCTWAYNFEDSLSGNYIVLSELKKLGYDATYFSRLVKTGSHVKSLIEVIEGVSDATSVDSNVLQLFYKDHPEYDGRLTTVCTWGPLPVHPVLLNKRMKDEMKQKIKEALLEMHKIPEWQEKLAQFNLVGFQPITEDIYQMEEDIMESVAKMSLDVVYY
jgi:ABC-type phosphate/phosphonate transport system substrate-binding protein